MQRTNVGHLQRDRPEAAEQLTTAIWPSAFARKPRLDGRLLGGERATCGYLHRRLVLCSRDLADGLRAHVLASQHPATAICRPSYRERTAGLGCAGPLAEPRPPRGFPHAGALLHPARGILSL